MLVFFHRKVRSWVWVVVLVISTVTCKNNPNDNCLNNSSGYTQATLAKDRKSYLYGGFIRLESQVNGSVISECDALIMPHQSLEMRASFDLASFEGITVSTTRSCLKPVKDARAFVVIYKVFRGAGESDKAYSYVKIPISSSYLERLGAARSAFVQAFGAAELEKYERLQIQMFRTLNVDYAHHYSTVMNPAKKISQEDESLLDNMQHHLCSWKELASQQKTLPSQRYEALRRERITVKSHIACFLYTDLMQFDAEVQFSEKQRKIAKDQLKQHIGAPEWYFIYDVASRTPEERQAMEKFALLVAQKSAKDLVNLERRVTENAVSKLAVASEEEKKQFSNLQAGWGKLNLYGQKALAGSSAEFFGNIRRLGVQTIQGHHRTPLEKGGRTFVPHERLVLMGNVADSHGKLSFHKVSLATAQKTYLDHSYFSLLMAFEKGSVAAFHPLERFHTGAFLMLGGQPVAAFTVLDLQITSRSDAKLKEFDLLAEIQAIEKSYETGTPGLQRGQQPVADAEEDVDERCKKNPDAEGCKEKRVDKEGDEGDEGDGGDDKEKEEGLPRCGDDNVANAPEKCRDEGGTLERLVDKHPDATGSNSEQCRVNPSLAGCGDGNVPKPPTACASGWQKDSSGVCRLVTSQQPTLEDCKADQEIEGCEAVLAAAGLGACDGAGLTRDFDTGACVKKADVCDKNPTASGCVGSGRVQPTPSECLANPTLQGCANSCPAGKQRDVHGICRQAANATPHECDGKSTRDCIALLCPEGTYCPQSEVNNDDLLANICST